MSRSQPDRAAGAVVGMLIAGALLEPVTRSAPPGLVRTNVRGRRVPVVLAAPLVAGALGGIALQAVRARPGPACRTRRSVAGLVAATAVAGLADDLRGDEPARGFRGHLTAAVQGRITGGVMKLAVGGAAATATGIVHRRQAPVVRTAALIALTSNLVNLLDRAPGRAAKVALAAAAPLVAAGDAAWATASVPLWGALTACIGPDLRERAMLGDAAAYPIGAVLGLGLALSLPPRAARATVALLGALNLASERWSFSDAIAASPWLAFLDRLGRRNSNPAPAC